MKAAFRVELLAESHDRKSFSCGVEALNRYLRTQATQDARRRIATCFVAIESISGRIAGYYTLASASIPLTQLPEVISKKLPRYPSIPAVRIGRLAVGLECRGHGLGAALLADALDRVMASPPAAFALLVDAKDDEAVRFYRHHGFIPLADQTRTLFLPIGTAQKAARP